MDINEVINFKTDLEKGRYISVIEVIEMVESFNEGIERKDLVMFLETIDIFSIRLHPLNEYNGLVHYGHPELDESMGEKIRDFLYLRENHIKDGTHDIYESRLSHLETSCWARLDLLRIDDLVSNTDIINWGKKHVLQHMYNKMVDEQPKVFKVLAENAQQAILKSLGLTQLDNNITRYAQQQPQDKELHKKIAELENKLSQLQETKPKVAVIPFGKRIDLTNKKLPPDERLKESYQIYSNDFSFHEDTHPVNTPDEMIKRIQGLLKVIKRKDSKILELEQQTNAPAHAQAEIDELKEQLSKASAELAAAKTATTAQPIDWQSIGKDEHIYPPELHLALMIWQRIYVENELKEKHIPSHNGKVSAIARKMGLNPDNTLGRRVAMLINTAHSKNKQDELADQLRTIEQLYMPPKKEKTTS